MTLDELIQRVALEPLTVKEFERAASDLGVSQVALCDAISREVGEGYLSTKFTYEFGDEVMNNLFATAIVRADFGLSDFGWNVFLAFDEGEYKHEGTPPEFDGEARTQRMLRAIFEHPTA